MDSHSTFHDTIMDLAASLQIVSGEPLVRDIMEAATLVLASIARQAMAGTDHIPHPDHSTMEKSSVGACFMAACAAPIVYALNEQDIPVDVRELLINAGARVFQGYSDADRTTIVEGGISLFQEILQAASANAKLEEWMASIHNVTDKYIRSRGDTEYVELFAPLYLVLLMATRQFDGGIRPNRES